MCAPVLSLSISHLVWTQVVARQLQEVLADLPVSADVLYLEFCYEDCQALRFHPDAPLLARASSPGCAAAMVYTSKGARRVLELCRPVFHAMDVMLPELIRRGMLEAYVMMPPAFHQDAAWGQGVDSMTLVRQARTQQASGISRPYCRQQDSQDSEKLASKAALSVPCRSLPYLSLTGSDGESPIKLENTSLCGPNQWQLVLVVGGMPRELAAMEADLPPGSFVAIFTAELAVGQWQPGDDEVVLTVPETSMCFDAIECLCTMVWLQM